MWRIKINKKNSLSLRSLDWVLTPNLRSKENHIKKIWHTKRSKKF